MFPVLQKSIVCFTGELSFLLKNENSDGLLILVMLWGELYTTINLHPFRLLVVKQPVNKLFKFDPSKHQPFPRERSLARWFLALPIVRYPNP